MSSSGPSARNGATRRRLAARATGGGARLLEEDEIYFNAGCLDRSFIVAPQDLVALEQPLVLPE
ncbi:MAG: hypothetical protein ACR2MU_07640 [Gaiellaceae bacterium]